MVLQGRMSGADFAAFMLYRLCTLRRQHMHRDSIHTSSAYKCYICATRSRYSDGVQGSMGELAGQVPAVMTALGAGEKVFELIALQPTIPSGGASRPRDTVAQAGMEIGELKQGEPLLAVNNVRFAYTQTKKMAESDSGSTLVPQKGPEVLKGISLEIAQGEMVALVGLSGSGKTSLVSLILRFYDIDSGSILLGGQDISSLDPSYLRAKVATVPQEPALFSVSMHDNIAYGLPNVSRAEVITTLSSLRAALVIPYYCNHYCCYHFIIIAGCTHYIDRYSLFRYCYHFIIISC